MKTHNLTREEKEKLEYYAKHPKAIKFNMVWNLFWVFVCLGILVFIILKIIK